MSHREGGSISDLGLLIIVLLILFFVWLATGGKNHPATQSGPFIKPYTDPTGPLEPYGN
jgi:hypothetical protein